MNVSIHFYRKSGHVKSPPPPPSETPDEWCDGSWLKYGDHCYLLLSAGRQYPPTTWYASRDRCRGEGGELASIHSSQENDWLVSKVGRYTSHFFDIAYCIYTDSLI